MERAIQTIRLLEASLREQGFETALDDSIPERPGFRTLLPLPDHTGPVRTELHYVPCGELFDVLQLYTTIAEELTGPALREMEKAVTIWNFSVFWVRWAHEDQRALYHRYCLALPAKLSAEDCSVMAESVLVTILNTLVLFYDDALALSRGMTFAQQKAELEKFN